MGELLKLQTVQVSKKNTNVKTAMSTNSCNNTSCIYNALM